MSDSIIVALITSAAPVATLVVTIFLTRKVGRVHTDINGRMTELIESSRAEGKSEEKEAQHKRDDLKEKGRP